MEPRHYINYRRKFDLFSVYVICFCIIFILAKNGFSSQDISPNDIQLKTIRDRVIQNERLFSLIKLDYTTKKSTSIPISFSDLVPRDPTESRTLEDSGASYVKNTWAQDDIKQYFNLNLYSDSNEWKSGFLHVVDGEVAKAGILPDLMSGNITNSNDFPWGIVDMIYLGLRPFSGHQKLSELLVKEHASFDGEIDVIDKRKAYTIGIKRPGKTSFTKMWIDCERGMPIRYEHYDRHPDSSGARLISEVKTIELHQLKNGGWFPVKGTRTVHYRSPKSFLASDHITVDVNSITIKREDIPKSLFNIDFPVGAKVYNAITGNTTIVAPTLSGKSLPDMKDFGINLSLADVNDKIVLVCFFDMEQRPSRNCILQISERAKEIKEKGIVIITVQASKIERSKLEEWIKVNNITLKVGVIEGDSEKTRSTWGVKSLPWLILTNKEHVVVAEGFSLDELDEKIKVLVNTDKPTAQKSPDWHEEVISTLEYIARGYEANAAGIDRLRIRGRLFHTQYAREGRTIPESKSLLPQWYNFEHIWKGGKRRYQQDRRTRANRKIGMPKKQVYVLDNNERILTYTNMVEIDPLKEEDSTWFRHTGLYSKFFDLNGRTDSENVDLAMRHFIKKINEGWYDTPGLWSIQVKATEDGIFVIHLEADRKKERFIIDGNKGFNLISSEEIYHSDKSRNENYLRCEYMQLPNGHYMLKSGQITGVHNDVAFEYRLETTEIQTDFEAPDEWFEEESLNIPLNASRTDYSFSPPLKYRKGDKPAKEQPK